MKKIYAIVSPAYTKIGDGFTDLASYLIAPLHAVVYELVCGYSLGHEVQFLETLEDAKKILEEKIKGSKTDATGAIQKAIVEMDVTDQDNIQNFLKLHTLNFDKRFEPAENNFFKSVRIPVWNERAIDMKKEASPDALNSMNVLYEASKKSAAVSTPT